MFLPVKTCVKERYFKNIAGYRWSVKKKPGGRYPPGRSAGNSAGKLRLNIPP
jgi:hypothetical protein